MNNFEEALRRDGMTDMDRSKYDQKPTELRRFVEDARHARPEPDKSTIRRATEDDFCGYGTPEDFGLGMDASDPLGDIDWADVAWHLAQDVENLHYLVRKVREAEER